MWRLTTFLTALLEALTQQYINGRKPLLRRMPYSIRSLYGRSGNGTHEYLIRDVRILMHNIEQAERWDRPARLPIKRRKRA